MLYDRYTVLAEFGTLQYELARTSDPQAAQVLLVEIRAKLKDLDAEAQSLLSRFDGETPPSAASD